MSPILPLSPFPSGFFEKSFTYFTPTCLRTFNQKSLEVSRLSNPSKEKTYDLDMYCIAIVLEDFLVARHSYFLGYRICSAASGGSFLTHHHPLPASFSYPRFHQSSTLLQFILSLPSPPSLIPHSLRM